MVSELAEPRDIDSSNRAITSSLPWWTWVLPFFISNMGTWLSIWFKADPGTSLWYLPTALGLVMAYWWGPRALLGLYLNAVLCAPLWDLPWQWGPLYALPETIEVGMSWFLFVKVAQGHYWLPDLRNVVQFLLLGSIIPAFIANLYLTSQLLFLGNIAPARFWDNWLILFSADLATHFVVALPALLLLTSFVSQKGLTQLAAPVTRLSLLPENGNSHADISFIALVFSSILILTLLFPIQDFWILYGFLMIILAIRYGVNMAVAGASWTGLLVFLVPPLLSGRLGVSTIFYEDFFAINLQVLFLCAVSLLTGRAISDLNSEIGKHKQTEQALNESLAERRQANEQLRQEMSRRERLEEQIRQTQKMEAIGHLAGGIAHDFNNLLVPIIGYTELSLATISPESEMYADLEQIKKAAERAAHLTQQILAFSRQQILDMRLLDLNEVILDLQKMLKRLIREDIELITTLAPSLPQVMADKIQIEQILINLVVNARDAMPTGGKLVIETAAAYLDETYMEKYADKQIPGPYVMIAVSDTGYGMDAETQSRIFDPFFTTKEMGQGTGLGLATVFGIVKQHQGSISVYSEPGRGSTFKIYLPQAEATAQFEETIETDPVSVYGTETILVVEDEELVRNLVSETLKAHGYTVLEASNPLEGVKLASTYQDKLDLLLTDVIMPQMNGQELYQKMAPLHPHLKVLFMSGYTGDIIAHQGILDKDINFLPKPFTVHALIRKIRVVLSNSAKNFV